MAMKLVTIAMLIHGSDGLSLWKRFKGIFSKKKNDVSSKKEDAFTGTLGRDSQSSSDSSINYDRDYHEVRSSHCHFAQIKYYNGDSRRIREKGKLIFRRGRIIEFPTTTEELIVEVVLTNSFRQEKEMRLDIQGTRKGFGSWIIIRFIHKRDFDQAFHLVKGIVDRSPNSHPAAAGAAASQVATLQRRVTQLEAKNRKTTDLVKVILFLMRHRDNVDRGEESQDTVNQTEVDRVVAEGIFAQDALDVFLRRLPEDERQAVERELRDRRCGKGVGTPGGSQRQPGEQEHQAHQPGQSESEIC